MTDFARLVLDVDTSGLRQGERDLNNFSETANRSVAEIGKSMQNIGMGLTAAVTLPLSLFGKTAFDAAVGSQQALAQVESALQSMGNASGRTVEELQRAAGALQDISLFDDDDILQKVTANLLTFGQVSGEQFDRAQLAIVNLAARLGTDLQSATIQVGRALNDPIAGLTGLSRAGIQFTDDQKSMIEGMVEAGNVAGAQAIILGELERQFGGAAQAARDATPGADQLQAWRTLQEVVGARLVTAFEKLEEITTPIAQAFLNLNENAQTAIVVAGALAAATGPLAIGLGFVATAFSGLTAAALPWIALGAGIAAAAYAIGQNWDKIGPALSETATMLQTELGPVFVGTLNEIKETALELWQGPFGDALRTAGSNLKDLGVTIGSVLGPVALATLRAFASLIGTTFELVGNVLNTVISLLSGDFAGAWEGVKNTVSGVLMGLLRLVEAVFPGIGGYARALYEGIKTYLGTALTAVFDRLIARIRLVEQSFAWLYDRVVGNSHIPDMVDEIGENMRRLDQEMVAPARSSASATEMAFRSLQQSVSGLLSRLFPERAQLNQYISDLEMLREAERKSIISAQAHAEARARLAAERMGYRIGELPTAELPEVEVGDTTSAIKELTESISGLAGQARSQTVQVAESFKQMADNVLQSLQRMVGAIKGGNFLDIFSSVLSFGLQLGGMGAFGSGVQSALNGARIPSFAGGGFTGMGPRTGGLDGRGGFLAMMHPRESVIDHSRRGANDNMGGGMVFNIDARGSSDPEAVRQQVQLGILEAAPSIVAAAEQRTISNLRRPRLAGVL